MQAPEVSPRWFTTVMGTAIVATAAASLPVAQGHLGAIAVPAWLLACALFAVVTASAAWHYTRVAGSFAGHLSDGAKAPFFGAVAMAPMALGIATLVVGREVIGDHAAIAASLVLWLVGTLTGLAVALVVPRRMARNGADPGAPTALLPVVSPIVSAAGGALLVPHLGHGAARVMTLACVAMLVASLAAAIVVISRIVARLLSGHRPAPAAVPALWLVLGPLGQSATAAGLLADATGSDVGVPTTQGMAASVAFGVPVLGLALAWLAFAAARTMRAARGGLPFSLGWWAFTFPVGTCVTAASVLARHTGAPVLAALATALFCLLVWGWALAASGTVRAYAPRVARLRFRLATQPGPSYTKAV